MDSSSEERWIVSVKCANKSCCYEDMRYVTTGEYLRYKSLKRTTK